MWAKGRYSNPVYGQHFLDALDLMARPEVGLVKSLTLGYRFAAGKKQLSTILANLQFADACLSDDQPTHCEKTYRDGPDGKRAERRRHEPERRLSWSS
jgi:hypothetical protein